QNSEMKEFFVKILTEYGSESFLANDYVSAGDYLKKAGKIDPENKEIKKMLLLCGRMTETETLAESSAGKGEGLSELVREFKKQKDKFSANFNYSIETINSLLKQSENERADLVKEIASQRAADRAKMNKIIIFGIVALVLILFLAFFITHNIMRRFVEGREIATLEHQRKIMNELRAGALVHTSLPPLVRNFTHEIITDIDPIIREKARRIELIEEELKTENDPNIATTFFLPYLDDINNRVRANAAKALYRHNKRLALVTFKNMISSADEWMRSSAVWALGEIADDETVGLITLLKNEKKLRVRGQIKATLDKLLKRTDVSGGVKAIAAEMLKAL
ncbi:HEAT repeat domain-containing protein, partial [bacterium]|nr:HEAT repeat domain-containing protein [bacterium]